MRKRKVFVFGSNRQGVHGKGAAQDALRFHGAKYGQGEGLQGHSYAIPTRQYVNGRLESLTLPEIQIHAQTFVAFARAHPELTFELTEVGTGLAGYTHEQIAPMFSGAPGNVLMTPRWNRIIAAWHQKKDAEMRAKYSSEARPEG